MGFWSIRGDWEQQQQQRAVQNNPDPTRTWRTIKSLSGTPSSTIFAERLLHKGRTFTTNQGEANAFMKEYATVNRLRFNKEERNRI